jgi:heme-degrading monooxygenase HmoA
VTHIGLFSVPTGEDDDFLVAWASDGAAGATLYRALRDDAEFRFAEIAEDGGFYEVVRADGPADAEAGCVLINPFEVPKRDDERFLALWEAARDALADARGYLGSRLHHAPAADFRFVDVARWSSPLMLQRATQRPEFQAAAAAIPYRSHPALYQPAA